MRSKCLDVLSRRPGFTVTAGFDGYIDSVAHVKRDNTGGDDNYFRTIGEFGGYISSKAGMSGSLELKKSLVKMGGNMPNYAEALSSLDVGVNCVGALGYPEVTDIFKRLGERCGLYSVCNPGKCDALEFLDGKLMLAENGEIDNFDFELLKERVGISQLAGLYAASDMITLLNWSELRHATSIWKGVLENVISTLDNAEQKTIFMDFSDCSARAPENIFQLTDIIRGYGKLCRVYVSVNENEARQLLTKLGYAVGAKRYMAEHLYNIWGCNGVIIHLTDGCCYMGKDGYRLMASRMIEEPKLLTGGGDSFNAGFSYALLSGLEASDCLRLANAMSGYYVRYGRSPDREELKSWMNEARYFEISEERGS